MASEQCSICLQAPAKFTCSCDFPAISTCAFCIATYLEALGIHTSALIQKLEKSTVPVERVNEPCDGCRGKVARSFCLCSVPIKKFCARCDEKHYRNSPGMDHFQHPIAAFPAVAMGKVPVETFRRKQQFIQELQLSTREELARFDAFAKQVEDDFDALINKSYSEKENSYANHS